MNRSRTPSLALLLPLLAACGGQAGDADGWAGEMSDSAGVAMVTNPDQGLWSDGPAWHLQEEFRIGDLNPETGEQEVQLGTVTGVDVAPDGRVYVADQQAQQIFVFDAEGAPMGTLGSPGEGPGEIGRGLGNVFAVDGEVWAADMSNMRVNRYDPEGGLLGAVPMDFSQGIPLVWHRVGDRVVVQKRAMTPGSPEAFAGDVLVTVGPEGGDTLTVLPPGQSFQMGGDMPRFRIFSAEPLWDAAPDGRLLSALNTEYRVEVREASGRLVRVLTKPYETREVTDTDERRLKDAMRKMMVDQGAPPPAVDQIIQGMTFADQYPALGRVMAGPRGTIWVQHIRTAGDVEGTGEFNPQDMGAAEWDVFGEDGRFLGVMTLPDRFAPLLVDGDAMWGVQRDEFDVNSVVRYRLMEH